MNAPQVWMAIAIIVLAGIALFSIRNRKNPKGGKISPLAAVAFAFVVAGIVFGENRGLGYGLMGTGVILSLIDMYRKNKKR